MKTRGSLQLRSLALLVALTATLTTGLHAQWLQSGTGNFTWSDTANWTGASINGQFTGPLTGAASSTQTVNFTGNTTVSNLNFAPSSSTNSGLTELLQSSGGPFTLTLSGPLRYAPTTVNPVAMQIGSITAGNALNISLSAATPTIESAGGSGITNQLAILNTISATGSQGLTKTGGGMLDLAGASTWTGALNINDGAVRVLATNGTLATNTINVEAGAALMLLNGTPTSGVSAGFNGNRVSDSATINLNGGYASFPASRAMVSSMGGQGDYGNLVLGGENSSTAVNETIGTLNLQSGLSRVNLRTFQTTPANGNITLTAGSLTRSAGTVVTFSGGQSTGGPGDTAFNTIGGGFNSGTGPQTYVKFTNAPTMTNGILPYALVTIDTFNGSANTEFAAYDNTNGIIPFSRTGPYATVIQGAASTANVRTYADIGMTTSGTINSLTFNGASGGGVNTNAFTLTLASGALLKTASGFTQTSGTINFNNQEAFVYNAGGGNFKLIASMTNIGSEGINFSAPLLSSGWQSDFIELSTSVSSGPARILAGTLVETGNSFSNASLTVANGATYMLRANNNNTSIGSLSGAGTIRLSALASGATTATMTVGGLNTDTVFSGNIHAAANGATISFANTAVTGGNLVKTGTGSFTLSGANTISGTTTVQQGTLIAGADVASTAVYGSAITVNSGADTLTLGSGSLANGNVVYFSAGTIPGNLITGQPFFAVNVSGSNFQVSRTLGGPAIDITSAGSAVTAVRPGAFGSSNSAILLGNASTGANTVSLLNGGAFTNERDITVANQGNGTTIGGNTADTSNYTGTITLSKAVNLIAAAGGTVNFNTTGSGKITGAFGVTKVGNGTAVLGGANDYTGNTTITAGTLLMNGSSTNTSAFSVSSGATLGGSGTIGGTVTVGSGGTLAPGTSPGNLTVNNSVTISNNATMSIEINGPTVGSQYDRVTMTAGTFSLTGTNNLALSLGGYTPALDTLFFLVDNQGINAISGVFESLNGVTTDLSQGATFSASGQQFRISYEANLTAGTFLNGNDIALVVIPEPSTWALLALFLTIVIFFRRLRAKWRTPLPS